MFFESLFLFLRLGGFAALLVSVFEGEGSLPDAARSGFRDV